MSIFTIALPVQAILPAFQGAAGVSGSILRPMLGLGMLAIAMVFFKPLLTGLLRAALLVLKPRESREDRSVRRTMESVLMLNRMARDMDSIQPSFAAELRAIAARGN
jgi:hypothetical protein